MVFTVPLTVWFSDWPEIDGGCPLDPDIAGTGVRPISSSSVLLPYTKINKVVISFVLASLATTGASIFAAFLDGMVSDEQAVLPSLMNKWLQEGKDEAAVTRIRRWRHVLDHLILAFADQQIISGFALLIACYIKDIPNISTAHTYLVVYLGWLASSSHLAAVITLRKYFDERRITAYIRVILITTFAILLLVSSIISQSFGPFSIIVIKTLRRLHFHHGTRALWISSVLPHVVLYWAAVIQLRPCWKVKLQKWLSTKLAPRLKTCFCLGAVWTQIERCLGRRDSQRLRQNLVTFIRYCMFLNPFTIFFSQVFIALFSAGLSVGQKLWNPVNAGCSLYDTNENAWGFGQILAMLLLLLPLFSVFEAYIGSCWPSIISCKTNNYPEERDMDM
jgi:hypothetical protein